MPASTLSGRSVALLRVNLDDYTSEGRSISHGNYTRTFFPFTGKGFADRRALAPPTAQFGRLGQRLSGSAQGAKAGWLKKQRSPSNAKARVKI